MPKRMNGVHGGSTKRKDITSNEAKDQELRSPNSLDPSHSNTEGPRNPAAVLASSNGALQRLADIAQYFESSFTYDINVVEGAYGTEMDRENEIQRLNETVETLTYVKSEEMDNLRRENEELKAGQEACERERETCQTMGAELEARHAKAEAGREEEYKRKLQDEKAKFQKSMRAKKAEIEAESKEKVEELEKQNKKLSTTNEELKQRLSKAENRLETKKIRHARVEKSLEEDNKKLTAELKQVKSEFPVEGQPVEY